MAALGKNWEAQYLLKSTNQGEKSRQIRQNANREGVTAWTPGRLRSKPHAISTRRPTTTPHLSGWHHDARPISPRRPTDRARPGAARAASGFGDGRAGLGSGRRQRRALATDRP
jgi:hypothetical protein